MYRTSDPYTGEVMNVQREDDGTFYVEIPELEWSLSKVATPQRAVGAALNTIKAYKNSIDTEQLVKRLKKSQSTAYLLQTLIELHTRFEDTLGPMGPTWRNTPYTGVCYEEALKIRRTSDALGDSLKDAEEAVVEGIDWLVTKIDKPDPKVSVELDLLLEDKSRVYDAMNLFAPDSPFPIKAVGFKLWKDVDGDGDGDLGFACTLWSKHKRLVD